MPEPSGSRTSMTTRSGWNRRASRSLRPPSRPRRRPGTPAAGRASREALANDLVVVDHEERQRSTRPVGHGVAISSCGGRSRRPAGGSRSVCRSHRSRSPWSHRRRARERMLVRPWWPSCRGRRIEAAPVVVDPKAQAPVGPRDPRPWPASPPSDGRCCDSASLTMPSRWRSSSRRVPTSTAPRRSSTSMMELCRNSSTSAASPAQGRAAEELRAQAEDEVADVADRQVEAVDGALDPPHDLVRVLGMSSGTSSSDSPTA